ncbi:hypothetical protein NESM_000187800 [Novymonas esmeraldas]|uniref:Exocyst complex component Sec8 n=1 Tax=Novymonas esmeraldas TaxID=1808958 RepID=A0AAW0F6K1_9TRYP
MESAQVPRDDGLACAMQLQGWGAYRETLRYVMERAPLFHVPSPETSPVHGATATGACVSSSFSDAETSASTAAAASVEPVKSSILRSWMAVVAMAGAPRPIVAGGGGGADATTTAAAAVARWTRLLGMWIAVRVRFLSRAGEGAAITDGEEVQGAAEGERYRRHFLPLAWSMLDVDARERLAVQLAEFVDTRGAQCARTGHGANCVATGASGANEGEGEGEEEEQQQHVEVRTHAMQAAQRVSRDYLRLGWDVLHPNSLHGAVDAKLRWLSAHSGGESDEEAGPSAPRAAAVHSHCLGDLRSALSCWRERRQRDSTSQQAAHGAAVALLLHSTYDALLQVGYDLLTKARASLVERCYYLVPALLDYEACLVLCEAAVAHDGEALLPHAEGLVRVRGVLRQLLQSLFLATLAQYRRSVETLLVRYKKTSAGASGSTSTTASAVVGAGPSPRVVHVPASLPPSNPLRALEGTSEQRRRALDVVSTGSGSSGGRVATRLSEPAFVLLVEVLEPTCELLRRCPAGKDPLPGVASTAVELSGKAAAPGAGAGHDGEDPSLPAKDQGVSAPSQQRDTTTDTRRDLVAFLAQELSTCFVRAAAGSGVAAKKAQQQAVADAQITGLYLSTFGSHGAAAATYPAVPRCL